MTQYGGKEYAYAAPFAAALKDDPAFRSWLLSRTKFKPFASTAVLLDEEMAATRSSIANDWWRSHYTERCRCEGCSGQETDILAIFEEPSGKRFALHVEVKQPTDRFPASKSQSANYGVRADCWVKDAPTNVVPHHDAATMLLCSGFKLKEYAPHPSNFDTVITFEQLRLDFPGATARL